MLDSSCPDPWLHCCCSSARHWPTVGFAQMEGTTLLHASANRLATLLDMTACQSPPTCIGAHSLVAMSSACVALMRAAGNSCCLDVPSRLDRVPMACVSVLTTQSRARAFKLTSSELSNGSCRKGGDQHCQRRSFDVSRCMYRAQAVVLSVRC